jgi:hypothetical protein
MSGRLALTFGISTSRRPGWVEQGLTHVAAPFRSGVLISALSFELMDEAYRH